MGKVLFLIILALVAVAVFRALAQAKRKPPPDAGSGAPQRMVTCAQCGLRLPEAEAFAAEGRYFCCEDHRRQAR